MVAVRGILGTIRELFVFLWIRRLWWLIPCMVVLLLFAAVIILGSAAGIGPFIYTLF
jgi:hypothetical protein